ncbi:MAG TPA: fibronectin type III domain-containing protein [Polyangiaceae bacterium]
MTIPKAAHRTLAALKLPRRVALLVAHAGAIVASMTDAPHFPSPVPPLWVVSKAISDLQNAETAALTRTTGTAATRNEKRTMLVSLLHQLRGYVQVIAEADPENARAIIESAGMFVRKEPERPLRVFSAKPGTASGEVKIVAPFAGKGTSYEWEYSIDGGATWFTMPPTIQSSTSLVGLTPGSRVMFKFRSVTRRGVSAWSEPIRVTVVK